MFANAVLDFSPILHRKLPISRFGDLKMTRRCLAPHILDRGFDDRSMRLAFNCLRR